MDKFAQVFLYYWNIRNKFKILNVKTKNRKEISYKDLRKAISVMIKKHITCRQKSKKIKSKRYYIFLNDIPSYYMYTFNQKKKQIDADIDFLKTKIDVYEKFLKVDSKPLWNEDNAF